MAQKQKTLGISDEENCARMQIPHETAEAADQAIQGFWKELYELRNKYSLANVSIIVRDAVKGEGPFYWSAHCGQQSEAEAMAAWYLGQASANRQELIRKALESGKGIKAANRD